MKKLNKLAIIGTVGVPSKYGGFETLAHHLVLNLGKNYNITVFNSSKNYKKHERPKQWNNASIIYLPFSANGFQSIIYDIISILYAIFFADTLLILGVSGCISLPIVKWFSNKKIVVNIDGLEWSREKWSYPVKKFLKWSESIAVNYADEVIADNAAIQMYVKLHYGKKARLIEYGSDHAEAIHKNELHFDKFPFLTGNYAFKVCRIEPENNIDIVLEAFTNKKNLLPLVLIGNWNNSKYGKNLLNKYKSHSNLYLLDPIYDSNTLNLLRSNATVYVHGHSAGGTNPSLVEAMNLGLPILANSVIYNKITTDYKAIYFDDQHSLIECLQLLTENKLNYLGAEMKKIAQSKYTWNLISAKYRDALSEYPSNIPVFSYDFELPPFLRKQLEII